MAAAVGSRPSALGFPPRLPRPRGGWYVNHKRLQRLWREEGLRVPQRRRRKRLGSSTTTTIADAANRVWAVDLRLASSCESRDLFPQSSFQVRG